MSPKIQDFRTSKDSNSSWIHKELDRKPFKWTTAVILAAIYTIQTSFIFFESTLKSFEGPKSYFEDQKQSVDIQLLPSLHYAAGLRSGL